MDKATLELIEKMETLLKKEARIPLANRLLSEQTAEIVANSWLNQSLNGIVHADLVEEGDKLHYHRVLQKTLKEGMGELKSNLRKNVYTRLILDLVEQEHDELREHNEMDGLYLFEMALELSKLEKETPVYTHMLNMIAFHQNEFGTLEKLRSENHPRKEAREFFLVDADFDELSSEERALKEDLERCSYYEPSAKSSERIHDLLVKQWLAFEQRVGLRVTCILNDSKRMKIIKTNLWAKQQEAEKILEYTEETCDNPRVLDSFKRKLEVNGPQFRNAMGKKIASQPEVAEKVYTILDMLLEREITAFDYLDIAVALAKANQNTTISMIEADLKNRGELFISPKEIIRSLART